MSNDDPKGSSRHRRRGRTRSRQQAAQAADAGAAPAALKGLASLERLRDRVEIAAHEITRLREENAALLQRVQAAEAADAAPAGRGVFLSLDNDPEMLRRKITGFIEAIDRYLEQEPADGNDTSDDDSLPVDDGSASDDHEA